MESLDKVITNVRLGISTPLAEYAVPRDRTEERPMKSLGRCSENPWFLVSKMEMDKGGI